MKMLDLNPLKGNYFTKQIVENELVKLTGEEMPVEERLVVLNTFLGIKRSRYCGKRPSIEDQYNLALEKVAIFNKERCDAQSDE